MPSISATSASVGVRPSAGGELLAGRRGAAGPGPYRAAGPVLPAQLVEQRAADPDGGEAVERDAPGDVEGSRGAEEGGEPGRGQVVGVDVAGHPVEQLPDQMANHRHVFADEVLEVARGRRVVGRADGGGEFGRGGHVVLLARTTGG